MSNRIDSMIEQANTQITATNNNGGDDMNATNTNLLDVVENELGKLSHNKSEDVSVPEQKSLDDIFDEYSKSEDWMLSGLMKLANSLKISVVKATEMEFRIVRMTGEVPGMASTAMAWNKRIDTLVQHHVNKRLEMFKRMKSALEAYNERPDYDGRVAERIRKNIDEIRDSLDTENARRIEESFDAQVEYDEETDNNSGVEEVVPRKLRRPAKNNTKTKPATSRKSAPKKAAPKQTDDLLTKEEVIGLAEEHDSRRDWMISLIETCLETGRRVLSKNVTITGKKYWKGGGSPYSEFVSICKDESIWGQELDIDSVLDRSTNPKFKVKK